MTTTQGGSMIRVRLLTLLLLVLPLLLAACGKGGGKY
jgi:predicted small secreted protein